MRDRQASVLASVINAYANANQAYQSAKNPVNFDRIPEFLQVFQNQPLTDAKTRATNAQAKIYELQGRNLARGGARTAVKSPNLAQTKTAVDITNNSNGAGGAEVDAKVNEKAKIYDEPVTYVDYPNATNERYFPAESVADSSVAPEYNIFGQEKYGKRAAERTAAQREKDLARVNEWKETGF